VDWILDVFLSSVRRDVSEQRITYAVRVLCVCLLYVCCADGLYTLWRCGVVVFVRSVRRTGF